MPKVHYPRPSRRHKSRSWEIYWKWNNRRYAISPGYTQEEDDLLVEAELRQVAAALASPDPIFPDKYAHAPAVIRYLADRYGKVQEGLESRESPALDASMWLRDYEVHIRQECVERWAITSMAIIRNLDDFVPGGIGKTDGLHANRFIDSIMEKGRSIGTRNRTLAVCSRFFKWALRTERAHSNPFVGIKTLKEPELEEIVYCTREERDRIIELAKNLEQPDWIAVPIAFFTGMRREEIFNMAWPDVLLAEKRVVVPKSKTKKRRVLPLAGDLLKLLESIPESRRRGHVVKTPNDKANRLNRADDLVEAIRKAAKGMEESIIPPERIRWNAWRHTFGSLLAQAGVSLDKISAWMGNTPDVCRRHYAQFVPRDSHDEEIEKL